ncbi:alpha/beta hydrolase [Nonomuraea roseoviolacea]|uniref:Acetyl esterase/lipase n=1 Tax=Nonomuraea roseoviolacea subsp. carminata TaxID=160689 RepID=A0ABT1K1E5_9ACTN|nr:alpha/beta hydrolase [Nonomuraea roseoviolacea]MCP2347821.1 acetyl esterase/lipase [Nonomuraea roseoviolacea subsp. carminata]
MTTTTLSGTFSGTLTGLDPDELAETRAVNARTERLLDRRTPLHVQDDAPAAREERRSGGGGFPPVTLLPEARWRTVTTPAGHRIPLRVLLPEEGQPDGVYLHYHGGGGVIGSADGQDLRLRDLANAANVAVLSVAYRLAPEHPYPAGTEDAAQAALWLVENAAAEFGTDRLVMGGESAGARLTVTTLLRLRDRHGLPPAEAFRAAQLSFGTYDLALGTPSARGAGERNRLINTPILAWFKEQTLPGRSAEERLDPDISPLHADLRGLPPARFVVGTEDPVLDDTLFMAARWWAAGNKAELVVAAEGWHGFTLFPTALARRELAAQQEFVRAAVRADGGV